MPLDASAELLRSAMRGGYAIGAFNVFNLEMVQAIVEAATEERSPVIVQASQGAMQYAGFEQIASLVKVAAEASPVPVVLHLDHGRDLGQVVRCIRAGFSSVMFDGSALPLEENVAITRQIVAVAHAVGIPVEAELGRIAGVEDHVSVADREAMMTDPEEARHFVRTTAVDSLAVAVGTIHQMTTQTAQLDFARIAALREAAGVPLVLHGASGVPNDAAAEAIARGVCKINVATHLNKAFSETVAATLAGDPHVVDPRRFLLRAKEAVKEAVRQKIRLFGSAGKA